VENQGAEMVEWRVFSPGQKPNANVKKIPYVPQQKTSDDMTDAQKEGVRVWNLMRKTLLDNGLMEEK